MTYSVHTITGVQSPSCKEGNKVSSKLGALLILKGILGMEIDPDSVPYEIDDRPGPQGHDSIVDASPVRTTGDVEVEVTVAVGP